MSTPNDFQIIAAMQRYGGSFVYALAHAAAVADPDNRERIKCAFPEYWAKYAAMVPAATRGSGALCSDEAAEKRAAETLKIEKEIAALQHRLAELNTISL